MHCGRKNRLERPERQCLRCATTFRARYPQQRYCSRACGIRYERKGKPNPALRRVERPPYDELTREIAASGYSVVGRRYGVSDNAIRKWLRQYEREAALSAADRRPPAVALSAADGRPPAAAAASRRVPTTRGP